MKTNLIQICLLVALLALPAVAQAQFGFTTTNGAITITGYSGPSGAVAIPSTINVGGTNLPVASIGTFAFANSGLTNVTISHGVTSIGPQAFYNCVDLISVTIPDSVNRIGLLAFADCFSLSVITIPGSVTNIEEETFESCGGLTCVTMGNGVTSIGIGAFVSCINLTNITIPGSVTSIGQEAFSWCTSLKAITVDAQNSFYSSMNGVLFDKSQTTLLQFPEALGGSYAIPNSVTNIGFDAFGFSRLTSITIPNSVTNIGDSAFQGCGSLTNVTIGNSVASIGYFAFFECTNLTSVTIRNGVASIGGWAFGNCTRLTSVTIPGSVTNIVRYAFAGSSLTSAYFEGNAPTSDAEVFGDGFFYPLDLVTVYYLPGTIGWDSISLGVPVTLWLPQVLTDDGNFGVRTNQFGFNIAWAGGQTVVVEACTNLANPVWSPVATNIVTSDSSYFSDATWTNSPQRFYRLTTP